MASFWRHLQQPDYSTRQTGNLIYLFPQFGLDSSAAFQLSVARGDVWPPTNACVPSLRSKGEERRKVLFNHHTALNRRHGLSAKSSSILFLFDGLEQRRSFKSARRDCGEAGLMNFLSVGYWFTLSAQLNLKV